MISVIIPVYNEEEGIYSLLSHIRTNCGNVEYEIIVVDGGSADNTRMEVLRAPNVTWILSPSKGRAAQMNFGAQHASGSVLFFLHADSTPPPRFLLNISEAHAQGFDAGCFRLRFDSENLFLRANAWFTRFNVNAVRFGDQGLFVKRKVFESSGGFRKDHVVLEDQEMVRRLRRLGARFVVISDYMKTSARKYVVNGPLRLQFTFLLVWLNYYIGKSQAELVRLYKNRISDSKISLSDAKARESPDDIRKKPDPGPRKNAAGKGRG